MGQDYTDVCPLLDRPPGDGDNYLQPVQVARDIELATRNLPPEVKEISIAASFWISVLFLFFIIFCRFLVLVIYAM